jgi:hypothetical protein
MIVTRRFVFLHLHKSGGTFVNQWLLRHFPDARPIGYHLPRRLIPAEFAQLPVIGLIRNPWSYYVSWYSFQAGMERPNPLFRILSNDGRHNFEGTIRNMLQLGSGGEHLDQLLAALPPSYVNRGLNLPGPELAPIRDSGLGFYSFLYRYMYAGEGPMRIVRMERMRDELPSLLTAIGFRIDSTAASSFAVAPATNTSSHSSYPDYYGTELRDLVGERDADVIGRHDYRFGD